MRPFDYDYRPPTPLLHGGVLLLRPEGLIPNRGRQRELHEADSEEEQETLDGDLMPQRSPS